MKYSIIDCSHIPMTYLFYIWRFLSLNALHLFCLTPHPSSLATTNMCTLSMSLFSVFICLFFFFNSTNEWNYDICLSVSYFIVFFCVTTKARFYSFCDWIIFHCVIYTTYPLSISPISEHLDFCILPIVNNDQWT